jgi:hypothetical protein
LALIHLDEVDPRRDDADEHLTATGHRCRDLLEREHFGTAGRVNSDRSHGWLEGAILQDAQQLHLQGPLLCGDCAPSAVVALGACSSSQSHHGYPEEKSGPCAANRTANGCEPIRVKFAGAP